MSKTVVVIPCFNEKNRLPLDKVSELLVSPDLEVLFVDDGSTDGTGAFVQEYCTRQPRAQLLSLTPNAGKSSAVRHGLLQALRGGADFVGYIDADFATSVPDTLRLIDEIRSGSAEVLLGSRVKMLGRQIERHAWRHIVGRGFATFAALILQLPVYDTQCGAKFFRATPLLNACLSLPFHSAWAFDVELIGRLRVGMNGIKGLSLNQFREHPLDRWCDVAGSKLRLSHSANILWDLVCIAYQLRVLARTPPPASP